MTRHIKKRLSKRMALKFRLLGEFIEENLGKESARTHRRNVVGWVPGINAQAEGRAKREGSIQNIDRAARHESRGDKPTVVIEGFGRKYRGLETDNMPATVEEIEEAVARRTIEKALAVPEELLGKEPKVIAIIGAAKPSLNKGKD